MKPVLWIFVGLVGLFIIALIAASRRESQMRASGVLPPPGKATMADVERLIQLDQKIAAIKCYREIHNVGLAEAKNAVDTLASELKSRDNK